MIHSRRARPYCRRAHPRRRYVCSAPRSPSLAPATTTPATNRRRATSATASPSTRTRTTRRRSSSSGARRSSRRTIASFTTSASRSTSSSGTPRRSKAFEDYLAQGGTQLSPTAAPPSRRICERCARASDTWRSSSTSRGRRSAWTTKSWGRLRSRRRSSCPSGTGRSTVARPDRVPIERFIDVAVGDRAKVVFDLPAPVLAAPAPAPNPLRGCERGAEGPRHAGRPGWPARCRGIELELTGVGSLGDDGRARGRDGGDRGARAHLEFVAHQRFRRPRQSERDRPDRSRAQAFGYASDVFLGATAVALGVAVYVTLRPHEARVGGAGVRIRLGLDGVRFQGDF